MERFGNWLASTRTLQIEAFDVDPASLTGDDRADYVVWNSTALVVELGEFLQEVRWKPWQDGRGTIAEPNLAHLEIVDVLHFVANIAIAVGLDDVELSRLYEAKQLENRDRVRTGRSLPTRAKSVRTRIPPGDD
jgi:hypothetical protein